MRFVNRPISRRSIGWLCLAICALGAAWGFYAWYPRPAGILEEMWQVRDQVWTSLRSESPGGALAPVGRWEDLTRKLPLATWLRYGKLQDDQRQAIDELGARLAALRLGVSRRQGDRVRKDMVHGLAVACFDAHRRCEQAYRGPPPTGEAHREEKKNNSQGDHHRHPQRNLGPEEPKPEVELSVEQDPVAGWNLHLAATHFRFAPERAGRPHVAGEGHAHLFIDGHKVARLYAEWYHISQLPPGLHVVRVTLNANDHSEYALDGRTVAAETTVKVTDFRQRAYFGTDSTTGSPLVFSSDELCPGY